MVAGSAALLLQAEPGLSPAEAKARLVNTADTDIDTDPFAGLAPITRIGGGEVRVDAAVGTPLAAWDAATLLPTLSFGHIDVADDEVKVGEASAVQNYSGATGDALRHRRRSATHDDAASGAVEVTAKLRHGDAAARSSPGRSRVELTITRRPICSGTS